MRIGVDFDNTIASYAGVFHRVAVESGLLDPALAGSIPNDKTALRDHLREAGREDDWIHLQGQVYGARMDLAQPYPGVVAFFHEARRAGVPLVIVSHKTRHPKRGPAFDLHAAARDFLERHGLAGRDGVVSLDLVFFEPKRADKLARVAQQGCTVFVDDLPEVLEDAGFPAGVTPILFDPDDVHREAAASASQPGRTRVRSWARLSRLLLPEAAAGAGARPRGRSSPGSS